MKEEFLKLYDYIINSKDTEKMHVLGKVVKSMMNKLIENNPQSAREYLDTLQAVKWHNYLTTKEAEHIVSNMIPKPLWNRTTWDSMMANLNLPSENEPYYNKEALYVTMQMICSDDAETLMSYLKIADFTDKKNTETLFRFIYELALNRLYDKDKMYNVREYFKL